MKILSTDQASAITGVAVFDDGNLIKYDLIDLHKIKDQDERFQIMVKSIDDYIETEKPDYVIIEDVSLQTNVATLLLLARIQGAIFQSCIARNIPYKVYKPTTWRKILGIKQGNKIKRPELKKQAYEYVLNTYGLDLKIDQCEAVCIGKAFLLEKD